MKTLLRQQAWLVLISGILFFSFLGSYALFNDAEPITAGCAAEMYRQGSWIVPTFNDQLQTGTPILIDWLLIMAFRFGGITEFSARVNSSLFAVASILLTYQMGRKLYSMNVAFLAGVILSTCLLFTINGRSATADSLSMFLTMLPLASYVWFVARQRSGHFSGVLQLPIPKVRDSSTESEPDAPPEARRTTLEQLTFQDWRVTVPQFMAMGLAVLSIGLVGAALPSAILLLFLLISRWMIDIEPQSLATPTGPKWQAWLRTVAQLFRPRALWAAVRGIHLFEGLVVVALIALPWYLAVTFATNGAWPRSFFFHQSIEGTVRSTEGETSFLLSPLYQFVLLHVGCFPWSVFLPVAIYRMWVRFEVRAHALDSDLLIACWIGVWFAFYSFACTNRPNELLPIYPAVALILARYLNDWQFDKVDMWVYSFQLCCRAMWIAGAALTLGIYVAAYLYFPGEQWLGMIGLVPVIGAIVAIKLVEQEQRRNALRTLVGTALLLAFMVVGVALPRMHAYQDTPQFIDEARRRAKSPDVEIVTFRYFEPSVVFYAGTPVHTLATVRQVADFLSNHRHGFVIADAKDLTELREELPINISEQSRLRNFLHGRELILLGRD